MKPYTLEELDNAGNTQRSNLNIALAREINKKEVELAGMVAINHMTLVPHGSRVLIRPDSEDSKSKIFIPDKFQKAADRGTVIAVGPGRRRIDGTMCPLQSQPGDRVVFSLVQIMRLEHEGEKLVVMDEDAILVFLKQGDPVKFSEQPASN